MSDHLPFEIQIEIIKKLPIKSLIQFRSVSKLWKSLIDSSKFINDHSVRHNQQYHLLVRYKLDSERKYVSIVDDDDNFPQNKFSPTVPVTVNLLRRAIKLGSSHGLLCFYGTYIDFDQEYQTEMVVLWNLSIRKSVGIVIPNVLYLPEGYIVIGFGVCPDTADPKLVKITHIYSLEFDAIKCVCLKVEVFTLTSGVWRSVPIDMPRKTIELSWIQVVLNGVIYWLAYDKIDMDDEPRHNRIISFDLKSEKLIEVFLSDDLAYSPGQLFISKIMDSLVVIESYYGVDRPACAVWKMNHGVSKSFKKLYTVTANDYASFIRVLEFRKNGEPIMETTDDSNESVTLEVCESSSGNFNDLGVDGDGGLLTSCYVSSYSESLLLLHQSDPIIY